MNYSELQSKYAAWPNRFHWARMKLGSIPPIVGGIFICSSGLWLAPVSRSVRGSTFQTLILLLFLLALLAGVVWGAFVFVFGNAVSRMGAELFPPVEEFRKAFEHQPREKIIRALGMPHEQIGTHLRWFIPTVDRNTGHLFGEVVAVCSDDGQVLRVTSGETD